MVISASKKLLLPSSGQKMEVVTHLPDSMVYIIGLQTFFMAVGHIYYYGLVCRPHMDK
jgi:hypothetical protein